MHAPNKAESFTGCLSAGPVLVLAFTCIPFFLLPPSRRMVYAPASPSASLSAPVPSQTVCITLGRSNPDLTGAQFLAIDQVQRRGHVIWVTYFKCEHLPSSCYVGVRLSFSRHESSWSDFQQLRGAEHALEIIPGLEYQIREYESRIRAANIPEHQLQLWSQILFIQTKESSPECLMPKGYRISLPKKSNHIVPTATRLYRVTYVGILDKEYYVEAEIFESYMKGSDSVQGLRKQVYTWSEFENFNFGRNSKYEEEFERAASWRGHQDEDEEHLDECRNKGWFGACLSFFYQ